MARICSLLSHVSESPKPICFGCTRPCGCTGSAAPSHFWWCCFPSCLWSEMCHLHQLATWACQNAHQFLHRPTQVAALHLGSKQRASGNLPICLKFWVSRQSLRRVLALEFLSLSRRRWMPLPDGIPFCFITIRGIMTELLGYTPKNQ